MDGHTILIKKAVSYTAQDLTYLTFPEYLLPNDEVSTCSQLSLTVIHIFHSWKRIDLVEYYCHSRR